MPAIDIFQFRELFREARSAAFVGNSSSVLQFGNGERIDGYDIVVRFNRAHTGGLEDKIGRRTDVLVSNDRNRISLAPPPSETLKPKVIIGFVKPKADFDPAELLDWIGEIPHLVVFGPDVPGLRPRPRTRSLTMGTYALYTFLRLFNLERIFVTGFTGFGSVPGGNEKYFEHHRNERRGNYHELDEEPYLLSDILSQFPGQLEATPEVEELVARYQGKSAKGMGHVSLKASLCNRWSRRLLRMGFRLRRIAEQENWLRHDLD